MRIRTIKPEFFASLTIDKLSLSAQRTFIGLWCYVDDEGRGLDDARLIKAALWPLSARHTATKVERDLKQIAEMGLVRRYEANGARLLQVVSWSEHQRISRPSASKHQPFSEGSVKAPRVNSEGSAQEGNREGNREQGTGIAPKQPARKPDHIFEALTAACEINPEELTKTARGALNKAVKDLRDVGADHSEIHRRARNYPTVFPGAVMTPNALARQWAQLAQARAPTGPYDPFAEMAKSALGREGPSANGPGSTDIVDSPRRSLPS